MQRLSRWLLMSRKYLFAAMWEAHRPPWSTYAPLAGPGSGLYRSTRRRQYLAATHGHGLPEGEWGRAGIAVAGRTHGKRIYATIDAKDAGLYRSDDGGDTWTLVNSDPRITSRAWYFNSITADPNDPDVVYIPNVALYKLSDGGKTLEHRSRRSRGRRLSPALDRSREFARTWYWEPIKGTTVTPEWRRNLEHLVQPADRAVLSRHHRQRISVSRLWVAAG